MGGEARHAAQARGRQLKTQNIVLDANLVPKVADFGLGVASTRLLTRPAAPVGTVRYMAPECLVPSDAPLRIPEAIDVFSYSFILHELAHAGIAPQPQPADVRRRSGESLRSGSSSGTSNSGLVLALARLNADFELTAAPHVSVAFAGLMRSCCARAPEARPTFRAVREQLMLVTQQGDAAAWATQTPK